jgi:hypothetical protein
MRKTLEEMQQHRFRTKINYNQSRGDLQSTREYSNLGYAFHLNHFKVTRFTKII